MRLCNICGCTFNPIKKKQNTCGDYCRENFLKKIKKCDPRCLESDKRKREVVFGNGDEHIQQFCRKCTTTAFVSGKNMNRNWRNWPSGSKERALGGKSALEALAEKLKTKEKNIELLNDEELALALAGQIIRGMHATRKTTPK